ncbi:MAG: acyl-CoA dehydrogenase family protein [Pseudomonadota bacterium]|nr:acyl-CoA dehydrogenase family protein [Pseudomonadota bacterium]
MATDDTLIWPFFADHHRAFAEQAQTFARTRLQNLSHDDVDKACKTRVVMLAEAGILGAVVPEQYGGLHPRLDARTLCLAREILAFHDGLADFAFAMQGLGSAPITLFGSPDLQARYLPLVVQGRAIAAFALAEPDAGSDVSALAMTAKPNGNAHVRLQGTKTFVSNGGIADFYVVFARSGEAPGARGLSAFVVDADAAGLRVTERIEVIAPHPLATLAFDNVRVPVANRLGAPGEGFKVAMATLDIFRPSVGAAALGFARRALHESIERATTRHVFGAPLADLQLTQSAIADSATEIDAAALLVYRAAWLKDQGAARVTSEAAMAKMFATEAAQRVIDRAVQLFGGLGVTKGVKVEELYREIRALRIYEGATEVQKIVIAREVLKGRAQALPAAAE